MLSSSNNQIIIVGTGYVESIYEYMYSPQCMSDKPLCVIDRDGTVQQVCISSNVVALMNAGPLVKGEVGYLPARQIAKRKFEAIEGAKPVRVPYEYCTCKPHHGCTLYEYIPGKQLAALQGVLQQLLTQRGITFPWDNQLGNICPRAQAGKSGIYFANSIDPNRWDIHPQRELIDLIKKLARR